MFKYYCLNPISKIGLDDFTEEFTKTEDVNEAEGILVRSAAMHDMELSDNLLAVARAGAGVNNIPLDKCAEKGIVVFNTPGANANGVKELVIAGMLLASRDVIGGNKWVADNKADENINKSMEKAKKMDCGALAITGNIDFYGKNGFVVAKTKGVRYYADPDADYFLIKELVPSFLDEVKNCGGGSFKEPDGYFIDANEAEEFDRHFPIKERLSLPGQIFG